MLALCMWWLFSTLYWFSWAKMAQMVSACTLNTTACTGRSRWLRLLHPAADLDPWMIETSQNFKAGAYTLGVCRVIWCGE
jgi:hypothetical protein